MTREELESLQGPPKSFQSEYTIAIETLWSEINDGSNFPSLVFQPVKVGQSLISKEIPYDITQMMTSALSRLAGENFSVSAFNASFLSNEKNISGRIWDKRIKPNYQLTGSVTEYDTGIYKEKLGKEIDLLVGGGSGQTDIGYEGGKSKRLSRITIDFQLLDFDTQIIRDASQSVVNTIIVSEIKKGSEYGFAIKGSNIGFSGSVSHAQGVHRAVRFLVDFSVLQLIGRLYGFPYWIPFNFPEDRFVVQNLENEFKQYPHSKSLKSIQNMLSDLEIDSGIGSDGTTLYSGTLAKDGVYGKKTQAYIRTFANDYGLSDQGNLAHIYAQLVINSMFSEEIIAATKENLQRLNEKVPKNSSLNSSHLYIKAEQHYEQGKYERSLSLLDILLRESPQNSKALSLKRKVQKEQNAALQEIRIQ